MLWLRPSEVAGLIGMHPHQKRQALVRALSRRHTAGTWPCKQATADRADDTGGSVWRGGLTRQQTRCLRGQHQESAALCSIGARAPDREADLITRAVEMEEGVAWGLRGQVDGWLGSLPVEVKTRMHRFYFPLHEYVQIQCYLHMLEKPMALLVQQFRGDIRVTWVMRSEKFWRSTLAPRIESAVRAARAMASPSAETDWSPRSA